MESSPGFGSYIPYKLLNTRLTQSIVRFIQRLAFALASTFRFKLLCVWSLQSDLHSLTHYAKGTPSPTFEDTVIFHGLRLLVVHQDSGSFQTSFFKTRKWSCIGSFHPSLTVHPALSVLLSIQPSEGGPPIFHQFDSMYSDSFLKDLKNKEYRAFTFSGPGFHHGSLFSFKLLLWKVRFGPVSIASTSGVSVDQSSSRYWDVSLPSVFSNYTRYV